MSSSNIIAFLHLCLCMHLLVLCNGRHLSHLVEENKVGMNANGDLGHVEMGVENIEISETSSISAKLVGEEKDHGQEIKLDGYSTKPYQNQGGATTILSKYLKNPINIIGNFISGKRSGSSSPLGYQQELQGFQMRTRSMLEDAPRKEVEETINSKENDVVEDTDVMDYAQPHRKPPIHNEEH